MASVVRWVWTVGVPFCWGESFWRCRGGWVGKKRSLSELSGCVSVGCCCGGGGGFCHHSIQGPGDRRCSIFSADLKCKDVLFQVG